LPKSLAARVSLILSALAIVAIIGMLAWYQFTPQLRSGPAASVGGPFSLIDQHGKTVTDQSLHGQYLLIYFGYTFCPDVCPTELQAMSQAVDALGPDGEKVTPVFITVDPARDTVEQLAAYAPHFHPRLVALTGTEPQIAAAAKAYRVYYKRAEDAGSSDYLMDHSSIIYLMGPDGAFLTHFSFGTEPEKMAEGMRKYL
jgi:protein SCO1/2